MGNQSQHMWVFHGQHQQAWQLGMGSDISSKLNWLTLYTIFATKSISLKSTKTPPTEQYVFDSSATNAFTSYPQQFPAKYQEITQ